VKLFITGAGGFLGRAVVDAASRKGHEVFGLVRSLPSTTPAGCTWVQGDLKSPARWAPTLDNVDAVIHLAAAKSGDLAAQLGGTLATTEILLDQMRQHGATRLVHVSSFVVYDYDAVPAGGTLDETTPLEPDPDRRDEYAQAKIAQEALVREFAAEFGDVTIVRPGAVWGANDLWDGGQAMQTGPFGLAVAPTAELKLTYVVNCAEAIVAAVDAESAVGAVLNITDDERPSAMEFTRLLREAGAPISPAIPVPFPLFRWFAQLVALVNDRRYDGRAKVPGLFVPSKLDPRFKPMRYPNDRAKRVLSWTPRLSLSDSIADALAELRETESSNNKAAESRSGKAQAGR
jgi:nucleoside-diphosphate-sugar epimerase